MWTSIRALIIVALAVQVGTSVVAKKYNVTVGYLPCVKSLVRDRQGITISGALSLALEEINNSKELLPEVNLALRWNDTKCDSQIAMKLITEMSNSGVVAFFGPEHRCETQAMFAQARNLPMMSYKCSDYQNSALSSFARINPSKTQAIKSVMSLLRYYRWNKFSLLYEESWEMAAMTLNNFAEKNNMTVNHKFLLIDQFKCCEEMMTCCDQRFWNELLQETKKRSRIYVLLGTESTLIEMMTAMESLQLFETGEYMVIFVDMHSILPKETMKYLIPITDRRFQCPNTPAFIKRSQSLLVVASSELDSSYVHFTSRVREYNNREPFKFREPTIPGYKFSKYISIYAAYLYDSVKLYATALHSLVEEDMTQKNQTLTYERLMSIATNGSRIVSRMITITPFKSVTGTSVRLDGRAESEGNFSVLAFKPIYLFSEEINCSHSMVPVGHFQMNTRVFPEYKLNPRLPIDWPDSVKPEDEPSCGFLNENCPKNGSQITSLTMAGTIAIVMLFISVCLFLIFVIVKKVQASTLRNRRTGRLLVVR